ncbi:hypothetical protein D1624_22215 [Klebsiella pneumoniae]|nr:hypothetical protein D1624_22215 [Klebsiella pneumoniae]
MAELHAAGGSIQRTLPGTVILCWWFRYTGLNPGRHRAAYALPNLIVLILISLQDTRKAASQPLPLENRLCPRRSWRLR